MKHNPIIIERLISYLTRSTQTHCLETLPKTITQPLLLLQLSYSPLSYCVQEVLSIHFILTYYLPDNESSEFALVQHLRLNSILQNKPYIDFGLNISGQLHAQAMQQPPSTSGVTPSASWVLHLKFNPQEASQLMQFVQSS